MTTCVPAWASSAAAACAPRARRCPCAINAARRASGTQAGQAPGRPGPGRHPLDVREAAVPVLGQPPEQLLRLDGHP